MESRWLLALALSLAPLTGRADTLIFADGTEWKNCYVRDEGIRLNVWRTLADVGKPPTNIPRTKIKSYKIERGPDWDVQPKLADLSVTHIEMTPKLAGLHGKVDYDEFGRATVGTAPALVKLEGDHKYQHPEEAVKNLKLAYKPGEPLTLTAHVRNLGFALAQAFGYEWKIDGKSVAKGKGKTMQADGFAQFPLKWVYQPGFHTATFTVTTKQPQIATINDTIDDPLWGFSYTYVVHKGRVDAWRKARTAFGTFSFEDFYRWHVDIMNLLFAESKYPSTPNGSQARVRLDKIIYADDVEKSDRERFSADGIRYDQGGWVWIDDQDRKKTWEPATHEWRNQTEWSLPHELGHQLGLTDWYNLDYPGDERFTWADNGAKVAHFMTFPNQMMHWHGPHLWGEVDAANLSRTWNKPRGYFGDHHFAMPEENFVKLLDVNGLGVPNAKIEIFQRGATVDTSKAGGTDHGVQWFPLVENGDFHSRLSEKPVIVGQTDADGIMRLPNRPVASVRTLSGYERKPNPFGNLNVVLQRGLMLMKATVGDRSEYFYFEVTPFNTAWFRGQRDKLTLSFRSPFGSLDSPTAPTDVTAVKKEGNQAVVSWKEGAMRDQHYLDWVIGYRVYRKITSDSLSTRPYMPIATLGPDARTFTVDLAIKPAENYWNDRAERFAVSAIGFDGRESALTTVVMKP